MLEKKQHNRIAAIALTIPLLISLFAVPLILVPTEGIAQETQQDRGGTFAVESLDVPPTALPEHGLNVTATIRNPTQTTRTEDVALRIQGANRDIVFHEDVTVAGNSTETISFRVNTLGFDPDDYIIGVTTYNSSALTEIELRDESDIDFDSHESNGTVIEVDELFLPEGGYVAIYDSTSSDEATIGDVIGVSSYLAPGYHEDIEVTLFNVTGATFAQDRLSTNQTLLAVSHRETNGDRTYDFVESNGAYDGPYFIGDTPVAETADVSVSPPTETETGADQAETSTDR